MLSHLGPEIVNFLLNFVRNWNKSCTKMHEIRQNQNETERNRTEEEQKAPVDSL